MSSPHQQVLLGDGDLFSFPHPHPLACLHLLLLDWYLWTILHHVARHFSVLREHQPDRDSFHDSWPLAPFLIS